MMKVTIPLEEFKDLTKRSVMLNMLLKIIYKTSELSWNKNDLAFDIESVNTVLKSIDTNEYYKILNELKEEVKTNE